MFIFIYTFVVALMLGLYGVEEMDDILNIT